MLICLCVHIVTIIVSVCDVYVHGMVIHMWRSENNFVKPILFPPLREFQGLNLVL